VNPEEGDQDGERPQGQDVRGATEVIWLVQLGEEKADTWCCHCWVASSLLGDLIAVYKVLKACSRGEGADLLPLVTSDRPRGNWMKLRQWKFILDMRKRFFTGRMVGHWNRVPREVVTAPNLSEFKECLHDVLNHIV